MRLSKEARDRITQEIMSADDSMFMRALRGEPSASAQHAATINAGDLERISRDMSSAGKEAVFYAMPQGFRIYEQPLPSPKIQVSDALDLPKDFRDRINAWLLERFGRVESPIDPDQCLVLEHEGVCIVPRGMKAKLEHSLESAARFSDKLDILSEWAWRNGACPEREEPNQP